MQMLTPLFAQMETRMQHPEIRSIQLREYWELSQELRDCERRGDKRAAASVALALSAFAKYAEGVQLRDAAARLYAPYATAIEVRMAAVILRDRAAR